MTVPMNTAHTIPAAIQIIVAIFSLSYLDLLGGGGIGLGV
jgi:hypothetical protein